MDELRVCKSSMMNVTRPLFLLLVVATQDFLRGWNIALIVIGAVAFVIGDGIAAFLGTMLAMRSALLTGEWLRHACACMYMYI